MFMSDDEMWEHLYVVHATEMEDGGLFREDIYVVRSLLDL